MNNTTAKEEYKRIEYLIAHWKDIHRNYYRDRPYIQITGEDVIYMKTIQDMESLLKDYRKLKKERERVSNMKVMISQPMNGKSEEKIKEERASIIDKFNKMHIDVVNTLFTEVAPEGCNEAVYYLGKSISAMKDVDAIYMCDGWRQARGCVIEHEVARLYGIKILYKDFFNNQEPINERVGGI